MPQRARERIAAALGAHDAVRIPDDRVVARAAVTLVLRPGSASAGLATSAGESVVAPFPVDALFVQRAELDGDPWSGHMALPGGRREPGDADLVETAVRELREETSLELEPADFLGRLDEYVPRNPTLPAIGITPFVAWYEGRAQVKSSDEVWDHVWISYAALVDPNFRSTLHVEHRGVSRDFATIEYDGYTIWGITYNILTGFLDLLEAS